jgi:RNA polymerase sigma-70 factor (ECF subfamily)
VFSDDLLADLADVAEARIDVAETRLAALENCMAGLSERQRDLVRMFYGEHQPAATIAKRWGRSVHAVYKALKVMRQALFDCVSRKLRDLSLPLDESAGGQPVIS